MWLPLLVGLIHLLAVVNGLRLAGEEDELYCLDGGGQHQENSAPGGTEQFGHDTWKWGSEEVVFDHVIRVSNSQQLSKTLTNISSSTHIIMDAGSYELPGSERSPAAFWLQNVHDIFIEGQCHLQDMNGNCVQPGTVIQCSDVSSGRGLAFYNSTGITLSNLTVTSCGALHWSTSWTNTTGQLPILVAMMFVECRNITMHGMVVSFSEGAGAFMVDVYGEVQVTACQFSNNNASDMAKYLLAGDNVTSSVFGGGGLLVEFPYCSQPILRNASENMENATFMPDCDYDKHRSWTDTLPRPRYSLKNNTFELNRGVSYDYLQYTFIRPGGRFHQAYGRGGGLSFFLKGHVHQTSVEIVSCIFRHNKAAWGAGFFMEMQDGISHTNITVRSCVVDQNNSTEAGGGARFGFIFLAENETRDHNSVHVYDTSFTKNTAGWGGGVAAYTSAEPRLRPTNTLIFSRCRWWMNSAVNAAAVALNRWHFVTEGAVIIPLFEDCTFRANFVILDSIIGRGTFLVDMLALRFSGDTSFCYNNGSALVLDSSSAEFNGLVTFHNNSGDTGGGVMLTGFSWITLQAGAHLIFYRNYAHMYGGALFCQTNSAHSVLSSRNCFLQYYDQTIAPDRWQATLEFGENYASASGNSIYATTLYHCLWGGDTQGAYPRPDDMIKVMNWSIFYYDHNDHPGHEIATTANILKVPNGRVAMAPGERRNLVVAARDDLNQPAETVVYVSLESTDPMDRNLSLGDDKYRTIHDDKMSSVWLLGVPGQDATINMRTLGSRPVSGSINVRTDFCYACYEYSMNQSQCVCLTDLPQGSQTAVSRCNHATYGCYLQNGYWGGFVTTSKRAEGTFSSSLKFVTLPCPFDYCDCSRDHGATYSECTLDHSAADSTTDKYGHYLNAQCKKNRVGRLCGKCRDGMSVMMGSNKCAYCDNSNAVRVWGVFSVVGILLTIIMIRLDFNILSGHVNSPWFYFQVLPYVLSDNASFRFTTIFPFSVVMNLVNASLPWSTCFYHGMDDLNKLSVAYAVPAYILLVVLTVAVISRYPRVQKWLLCGCGRGQPPSVLKTLCSLLAVFYVSLVANSFELLAFTYIGETGPWLYRDANVKLWGARHAPWGIFAVLVIAFIAVPIPLFLLLGPRLQRRYSLARFKPLLDIVQAPYAPNRRSFAGFYFAVRLVILIITTTEIIPLHIRQVVLQLLCLSILVIHMMARPYGGRFVWLNYIDSVILAVLAATIQVNFFYGTRSDSGESSNWAYPVIVIFMALPLLYLIVFSTTWVIINLAKKAKDVGLLKRDVPSFRVLEQSLSASSKSTGTRGFESSYDQDIDVASILWAASSQGDPVAERQPLINGVVDDSSDHPRMRSYSTISESDKTEERHTNSSHGYVSSSTIGSTASRRSPDPFDSNRSVQRKYRNDSGHGEG